MKYLHLVENKIISNTHYYIIFAYCKVVFGQGKLLKKIVLTIQFSIHQELNKNTSDTRINTNPKQYKVT